MTSPSTAEVDLRSRLIQALMRPDAYSHATDEIEHLQTHISDVFLTGAYAYKLKKPLDLGFLDFSSLEKRRHYCEEELRLNRRLAPDLYLAVVTIAGEPDHPHVGADGPVLEYALQMRQFDQHGLLERVLTRGELTAAHTDELAETLSRFHAELPPATGQNNYGTAAAIMGPTLQNFDQLAPLLVDVAERAHLDQVQHWTVEQHRHLATVFEQRREDGFVRECHGDLHLGNMVLIDGRVRIFDCIEFNATLRWIDVMNEAAFVSMDLLQRRHAQFAYRFLDRYLQLTGDYRGVPLLRYYMVYRALVRAKVAAMRAAQSDVPPATRRSLGERCRAHIEWASKVCSAPSPALIIMHGLAGAGKSVLSQRLVENLGAIRIRSDVERKRLHGLSADTRSGSGLDAGLYSAGASEATYEHLRELARSILTGGFTAVIDAAFLHRSQRDQMRSLAQELGLRFGIAHAQASRATLRERITRRAAVARDASEATIEVLEQQLRTEEPLDEIEQSFTVAFDTERDDARAFAQARGKWGS